MRKNIANVLETDIENISIKATTTEHIHIIIQEIKAENLGQNGKLRG